MAIGTARSGHKVTGNKGEKMESIKLKTKLDGTDLILETGKIAPQASGAVTIQYGDTVILATAVMSKKPREGIDFLPLLVDYEEKLYAAGKISSSRFIKREGRPSEKATLKARLIDRTFRPLLPKEVRNDIQIIITVLSVDEKNDPIIASIIGASAALAISNIPVSDLIGAVRVGLINNQFVLNPDYQTTKESKLNLIVSASQDKIVMIESESKEAGEEKIIEAIEFAHKYIKKITSFQKELTKKIKKEEYSLKKEEIPKQTIKKVKDFSNEAKIEKALLNNKLKRDEAINKLREETIDSLGEITEEEKKNANKIFNELIENHIRKNIFEKEKRADGRKIDEVRSINCEVGILPRTHGSGLFNRGYTQVLTITTLASSSAEQILEGLDPENSKRFMHHYNFPPFSVGETSPLRFTSRREIGHGSLAEKAINQVMPDQEKFPYTIRLVSEVLSSDGSTSMASTCGSTLALMDAGVPISAPVAGIAMGLVTSISRDKKEQLKKYKILTDISGTEDFCGDMDFKIAGTKKGITAIQLDIKIKGINYSIIKETLEKAKKARIMILEKINKTIPRSRTEMSPFAPRIATLNIPPDKIRNVIGPSGKIINKIIQETGVEIDIEETGEVNIFSSDSEQIKNAVKQIEDLTKEAKIGEIYNGKVKKITEFGAFVEILPKQEGLVHISQLAPYRVEKVTDEVKVGDEIPVKVIGIDEQGRINLSKKALIPHKK